MTKNNDYWLDREKAWINQNLADDQEFAQQIEQQYQKMINSIDKQIKEFYIKYANVEHVTMSEAIKRVSQFDVKSFEKTAAKMVKAKDFSDYANAKLKLYNATMKINRLEYLKSEIGLELVKTNSDIEQQLGDHLTDAYRAEVKRQSGILGYHNQVTDVKNKAESVANADFHGATWSQRLWANNDALKSKLDTLLTQSLIQGLSIDDLACKIKDQLKSNVKNATYVAQRLARTETARVQDQAQNDSFKRYGIEYVKWVYEPTACAQCVEIGEAHDGIYKLTKAPGIPVHANCRCSKAAYVPDKIIDERNPVGLDDDELKALYDYKGFKSYYVNYSLRNDIELTDEQKQWTTNLDRALDKLPLFDGSNTILKRSFPNFTHKDDMYKLLNQLYTDKVYAPKSYISASKDTYDKNDVLRMIIKKSHSGRDLKGYNDGEQEVLFKRGTKFKVLDIYLDDNKPIVILEEI